METKTNQRKPDEVAKDAAQDSNTPPSAHERKNNIPQSNKNATEENTTGSKKGTAKNSATDKTKDSTPDPVTDETAQIFNWLEEANQNPRQLKGLLDTLDTKIGLIDDILSKESEKSKKIPGIDRRIETLGLSDLHLETSERHLSDLYKINLETELTNLKEKRFLVSQKFVKVCGSQKKALKYESVRAKAKSQLYHKTASYFIKKKILKILNTIIEKDKPALVEVRKLAGNISIDGSKGFNDGLRDLLEVHDDYLVIQCSHHNREYYYKIFRLTILSWNPESDIQINEIIEPAEA